MANLCNIKLLKDILIAKPHEMSFQLMSSPSKDKTKLKWEKGKGYAKREKLILIKTRSIIDPEDYVLSPSR